MRSLGFAAVALLGCGTLTAQSPAVPMSAVARAERPDEQPARPAEVRWDARGLWVQAANASLNQILRQVAAATGATLQGAVQEQRVFGSYGPGPGCEVLARLLAGSGTNVLMMGSRETGAPLRIVLSPRLAAGPQASRSGSATQVAAAAELDPVAPPVAGVAEKAQTDTNPFNLGGAPRDSTQFMQEILARQQVIDEQQEKQAQESHTQRW